MNKNSTFINGLGYLAALFVIFFSYSKISACWVDIGGLNTDPFDYQIFFLELPLLIAVGLVFFCRRAKGYLIKFIIPLLPMLFFYIFFDIFYIFLKRSPHPSDLRNIITVFDFSPKTAYIVVFFVFISFLLTFYFISRIKNQYSAKGIIFSIVIRLCILFSIFSVFYFSILTNFIVNKFNYIDWSQERTIKSNGRISSFIYYGLKERKNRDILNKSLSGELFKTIDINNALYPKFYNISKSVPKNIHLIVLESFLDPRLLKNIKFNISPLAPELKPFLIDGEKFSLLKSPVYGGRTAQAEFELLTGIPALAKVDSIEFNVMMGNAASSFVRRLNSIGYKSMATVASSSCYFNVKQAYRSIGFNNVSFLKELDEFHSEKDYLPIFDSDVFEYNLKKVKKFKKENTGGLFNYVIGMYGHFPYETVREEHHDVIKIEHEDERVHKIANQFFYRTKAVAAYIKQLQEIDPNSIICIVSDHLPPILWDGTQYQFEQEINIAILIDGGKIIDTNRKEYYKIPRLIWGNLFQQEHIVEINSMETENIYFKFLSESMF